MITYKFRLLPAKITWQHLNKKMLLLLKNFTVYHCYSYFQILDLHVFPSVANSKIHVSSKKPGFSCCNTILGILEFYVCLYLHMIIYT